MYSITPQSGGGRLIAGRHDWLPQRDAGLRVSPKAERVSAFSGAAAAFFLTTAMARTAAAKTEKLHLNE